MIDKSVTELLIRRKKILTSLGWISQPTVKNKERLYLLEEETRNSIMIEWYISDKKVLKEVISNNKKTDNSDTILWYFDAASLIYEYAFQKYNNKENFLINHSDIKTVHSLMLKWQEKNKPWEYRKWDIIINKANIKPPLGAIVQDSMDFLIKYTNQLNFDKNNIITSLAKFHILFESNHPFEDGNGRVWRILLNYILVANGYPNIIIKWVQKEKDKYFKSLESGEQWLYDFYPDNIPTEERTKKGDLSDLENILIKNLFETMDYTILSRYNETELLPVSIIAKELGYKEEYGRKLVERWKIIAKKIGNTRYSHPELIK